MIEFTWENICGSSTITKNEEIYEKRSDIILIFKSILYKGCKSPFIGEMNVLVQEIDKEEVSKEYNYACTYVICWLQRPQHNYMHVHIMYICSLLVDLSWYLFLILCFWLVGAKSSKSYIFKEYMPQKAK